jgi:large subunit ribosomal protein L29
MNYADIKGLSVAELKEKIGAEKEALRKLQFAHQISSIENPMKLRATRKLIAKLNTALTEKVKAENK